MNVLLLTSHSIAEYDDLRMLSDLGYDAFSIGAYSDPSIPSEFRPAIPGAPDHPELREACHEQRVNHANDPEESTRYAVDWAKADLHPKVLAWADVVICHHYLDRWIAPQFERINNEARVVWRTCGQSNPMLERMMGRFRGIGLDVVRYSPREEQFFREYGAWAGQNTTIRFGKYPDDYPQWDGRDGYIANVTQDMIGRGDFCGLSYWVTQTFGLDARPAGPKSEQLPGGIGALPYPEMLEYLKRAGVYLYTGTSPASYTLGLMEAMFVGVPIVTMPEHRFPVPKLYEASDLVGDDPEKTLDFWMGNAEEAHFESLRLRERAQSLFGIDHISRQWAEFLG